jgi:glutathione S-transferase
MPTLYYAPNTISLATLIALEEAGASYDAVRLDFTKSEQRGEAYLAVNPKGRVPSLVTERGILTETPATLAYIAQSYPAANLAPLADPFQFAEVQAFNCYLCATVHVAHAHGRRGYRWTDDQAAIDAMKRFVPISMSAAMKLVEAGMLKGPWVMGEAYTICDPYLFTVGEWLEGDGVDPAAFPRVLEHRRRMAARPAVQRAKARMMATA